MPARPVGVTDTANADTVAEIDVIERGSPDIFTTSTADPGSGGTSLAVTSRSRFPQSGNFKIRVELEVMLVTAGHGTGAGSFTVTRGVDGTTAVAHTSGVVVSQVVGVQRVEPVDASRMVTYRGRANTFRIPGRAGTSGQKLLSLHNSTSSLIKVRVNKVWLDHTGTVIKAVTVIPPIARLWKVTVLPTNGSALTRVPLDSALSPNSQVTLLQDASADGTGSGTTLTATLPAATIISEHFVPRIITGVGKEPLTRINFLDDATEFVTLNALEGVVVFLDYTSSSANPTTDHWIAGIEWEEYTIA